MNKLQLIDWQKLWKQRDKALGTLKYNVIGKSIIRQVSTLIINDIFDKTNNAKVKVRGIIFDFRTHYGKSWHEKEYKISVEARCLSYYEGSPSIKIISKEFQDNLSKLFNQIDELKEAYVIGVIKQWLQN